MLSAEPHEDMGPLCRALKQSSKSQGCVDMQALIRGAPLVRT